MLALISTLSKLQILHYCFVGIYILKFENLIRLNVSGEQFLKIDSILVKQTCKVLLNIPHIIICSMVEKLHQLCAFVQAFGL